jgi:hypothetical protein
MNVVLLFLLSLTFPCCVVFGAILQFTRSIRIILAVARGLEARVDNRMYEVLVAEGL